MGKLFELQTRTYCFLVRTEENPLCTFSSLPFIDANYIFEYFLSVNLLGGRLTDLPGNQTSGTRNADHCATDNSKS